LGARPILHISRIKVKFLWWGSSSKVVKSLGSIKVMDFGNCGTISFSRRALLYRTDFFDKNNENLK
jgi:hypothetical protein